MKKITLLIIVINNSHSSSAQPFLNLVAETMGTSVNSPPISPYFMRYSYSQSIYLASEIGTSGRYYLN